jgi:hypothetical protein
MSNRRKKDRTGSGELKDELLQLRIGAVEKKSFEDAANVAGLALSAWVRERLRQAAIRELEAVGKRAAFLEHLI